MNASADETHQKELLHKEVEQVYSKYVKQKEGDYPQWIGHFTEEERLAQFEEDLEAGNTVPILLTVIAGMGLVMAAILLWYVT